MAKSLEANKSSGTSKTVLSNGDDYLMMEEGKTPLLSPFNDTESVDDMFISNGLDNNNNNDSKITYVNTIIPKSDIEDSFTKDNRIIFEHDQNQLRDYYYEKRHGFTLLMCIYCFFLILYFIILFFPIPTYVGLGLFYAVLILINLCYNFLLKYFRSSWIDQIVVDQSIATFITSNGIGHVQPHEQNENKPNGGEIFLPFNDIEDVDVTLTPATCTFAVTKVDIKLKQGHETIKNEISRFVVSGYPSFLLYNKKDLKYKIEIFGLANPHNFKCAIMKKILKQSHEADTNITELPIATVV